MASPFHPGERAIQSRAGVRDKIEAIGERMIRSTMTEQLRAFFPLLPWLLLGSLDADGQPHASLLWGAPGFVHAPTPALLRVDARPEPDDPLARNLRPGASLGALGLELPTRRRNRVNGALAEDDPRGLAIAVRQAFGNCPKYIQARTWSPRERAAGPLEQGEGHDPRWLALLARADTLFLASHHADPLAGGVDISHRGGPPGFLHPGPDGRLWLPDYSGNLLFNTLGNLLQEPRCGLLCVDFASGDLLQLEARVAVYWPEQLAALGVARSPGAERLLALTPGRWRLRRSRLPLAFGAPAASPFLPAPT